MTEITVLLSAQQYCSILEAAHPEWVIEIAPVCWGVPLSHSHWDDVIFCTYIVDPNDNSGRAFLGWQLRRFPCDLGWVVPPDLVFLLEYMKNMKGQGVIEKSNSLLSLPVMLDRKKNREFGFSIDNWLLIKVMKNDYFSLTWTDNVLDTLA